MPITHYTKQKSIIVVHLEAVFETVVNSTGVC